MAVIDRKDYILLDMKERLLSLSPENAKQNLEDYKRLAYSIDKKMFESISSLISQNSDYSSYPYEKQLEVLLKIEKEYTEYYKFQIRIINVCHRYGDMATGLSNIGKINISEIRKRIQNIKTYLENLGIINDNSQKLDNLNRSLITQTEDTERFAGRISDLDIELKKAFLNAEGRYNSSSGLQYASSKAEAKELGIDDLASLLDDSDQINQMIERVKTEVHDLEDTLKATKICCANSSSGEYDDICLENEKMLAAKNYELIFLQILSLISLCDNTYEGANNKRERLAGLISQRASFLEKQNINFVSDPLNNIGLDKQLVIIQAYGKNVLKAKEIKNEISVLANDNDIRSQHNNDIVNYLKKPAALIYDNNYSNYSPISKSVDSGDDVETPSDSKVVSVKSLPLEFNRDVAYEKAESVILKVCELYTGRVNNGSNITESYAVSPQLVIEPKTTFVVPIAEEKTKTVTEESDSIEKGLLVGTELVGEESELPQLDENSISSTSYNTPYYGEFNDEDIFDDDSTQSENDSMDLIDDKIEKPVDSSATEENDLFQIVDEPFEATPLFTERIDGDDIFEPVNHQNVVAENNTTDIFTEKPVEIQPVGEGEFWTVKEPEEAAMVKKLAA